MRVFKLRPGDLDMMPIDRDRFERETGKRHPWYQPASDGETTSQFAVCPACDNPIQIVGLYRLPAGVTEPFGKHTPRSIRDLADLDIERRDDCPFFKPRNLKRSRRRRPGDPLAANVLKLVIEQFDRIAWFLEKDTGIRFGRRTLKNMLESYRRLEGHRYAGATPINVPWTFAYMTTAVSLYGQRIVDNDELARAICTALPDARIGEDGRIGRRDGANSFLDIRGSFICHERAEDGSEAMTFQVYTVRDGANQVLYSTRIRFRPRLFVRLVRSPDSSFRRPDLIDMAKTVLGYGPNDERRS